MWAAVCVTRCPRRTTETLHGGFTVTTAAAATVAIAVAVTIAVVGVTIVTATIR